MSNSGNSFKNNTSNPATANKQYRHENCTFSDSDISKCIVIVYHEGKIRGLRLYNMQYRGTEADPSLGRGCLMSHHYWIIDTCYVGSVHPKYCRKNMETRDTDWSKCRSELGGKMGKKTGLSVSGHGRDG